MLPHIHFRSRCYPFVTHKPKIKSELREVTQLFGWDEMLPTSIFLFRENIE